MILRKSFLTTVLVSLGVFAATVDYQEDTTRFPNPERGWVRSFNPLSCDIPAQALTVDALEALRDGEDNVTLVRKYYLLKTYRDVASLPQSVLDGVTDDMDTCRAAGLKIIPRFVYEWCTADGNTDAPEAITLGHLDQIKPVLAAHADVIAFVEAGLVGQYGEWHHSFYDHVDNFTNEIQASGIAIRDKLLEAVPQGRFLAMRYMYWHKMKLWPDPVAESQAFGTDTQARIGYHHDYVSGSSNWDAPSCGECPGTSVMRTYYAGDTRYVLSSGEPCSQDTYYQSNDPQPELRNLHFSTLVNNACIDYSFWQNAGWYEGLGRDLGYRFRVVSVTADDVVAAGENLGVRIELANDGYAACFNERRVEILLRSQDDGALITSDITTVSGHDFDPRFWHSGSRTLHASIPIPPESVTGDYDVLLHLPDPAQSLHGRPQYSIRLANQGVWEESTGYNDLGLSVEVTVESRVRNRPAGTRSGRMPEDKLFDLRGARIPAACLPDGIYFERSLESKRFLTSQFVDRH